MSEALEIIWQDKVNNTVNVLGESYMKVEKELTSVKNKLSDCQAKLTSCNGKLRSCENEDRSMGWVLVGTGLVFIGTVLILIGILYTYNSIRLLKNDGREAEMGEIILYWFIFVSLVILLIIGLVLLIPLIGKLVRIYKQ